MFIVKTILDTLCYNVLAIALMQDYMAKKVAFKIDITIFGFISICVSVCAMCIHSSVFVYERASIYWGLHRCTVHLNAQQMCLATNNNGWYLFTSKCIEIATTKKEPWPFGFAWPKSHFGPFGRRRKPDKNESIFRSFSCSLILAVSVKKSIQVL